MSLLDGWSRRFAQTLWSPAIWFSAGRAARLILAGWEAEVFAHCEHAARELVCLAPRGCAEEWYWVGLLRGAAPPKGVVDWRSRIGKVTLAPELRRKSGALTRAEWKAELHFAAELVAPVFASADRGEGDHA